jgi:uncharacterized protein YifN (PemK superfamily)
MALNFHPVTGTIVICDFQGFIVPEMVKRRPSVVISPKFKGRDGLCTIVPLSTTPPPTVEAFHLQLQVDPPLPYPYDSGLHWVKCDMIYAVSLSRCSLPFVGKDASGKRQYDQRVISQDDLKRIQQCVLNGLGISFLTIDP